MSEIRGNILAEILLKANLTQAPVVFGDYTITVEEIENGHRVNFTKGSTTQSVDISNGSKGDPFRYSDFTPEQLAELKGEPFRYSDFTPEQLEELHGKNGLSPSARVEQTSEGATLVVTDEGGTTTAMIRNGRDGEVTKESITDALGYPPANANQTPTKEDLSELAAKVVEYKTVTISVKDTEGNPVVGSGTVVVSDGNGNTYSTISYSGNAVVQRLPIGFGYRITVNDDIDGYYSPDTINGVVTGDAAIVVTMHKIGVISSFADIQYLVQHGIADRVFSIGDQIHVDYTYSGTVYDCPFDVVAFENVTLKDGSVVPGMYLQQHFATIESILINNAEQTVATEATAQDGWYYYGFTSSSVAPVLLNLKAGDTIDYSAYPSIYKSSIRDATGNIARYGYNNYAKSIYREWLNSDAAAGQWHTAQYPSQPTPSQVNQYRGYIAGLDPEFVAIVGETEQKVALNTVTDGGEIVSFYDKFFLPSLEQLYGVPQAVGVEGSYWPYWKTTLELNAPSNAANEKRKVMALNAQTTAQYCRLRSAYRGHSSAVWYVSASTGELYYYAATTAFRCAPACVIC